MTVLSWDKPPKKLTTEEWKSIQADSAPPGVYTPNMSRDDALKWKAKKVGGDNPRVEVRKTVAGNRCYAQVLMIVTEDAVKLSMNGTAHFTTAEADELGQALLEARAALKA